jgi:glutathione synthase/RimK-type ligase-like ATP-grasp enzyme
MKVGFFCKYHTLDAAQQFSKAAVNLNIDFTVIPYDSYTPSILDQFTHIILRYDDKGYDRIATILNDSNHYPNLVVLDKETRTNLPFNFRSKRECGNAYVKSNLPYLRSLALDSNEQLTQVEEVLGFPVMVKKAISSQNEGNHTIDTMDQLFGYFKTNNIHDYQIQKYIPQYITFKFFVFRDTIIGNYRTRDTTADKSAKSLFRREKLFCKSLPEGHVRYQEFKRISFGAINVLKADLVSVDIMLAYREKRIDSVLLEANLSPRFESFAKQTGIDLPKHVLQYLSREINGG